jgi:hypothetical protein
MARQLLHQCPVLVFVLVRMALLANMHVCAYSKAVRYAWDEEKAAANLKKHSVDFADAVGVFDDEFALRREDPDAEGEERFIALGMDHVGRAVAVVYT